MSFIEINIYKSKKKCKKPKGWHVAEIFFSNYSLKTKGTILMQSAKVDQKFTATWPGPKDKYGNDAAVQADSIQFLSDDPSIAEITANPDGGAFSATVTTKSKVGSTMVRISADADLGEGVKPIEGLLSVEVLPGDAVAFGEASTTTPEDNQDTPE